MATKELRVSLPILFPEQERILASTARFNVVAGGGEAGKTTLAIDALLMSRYGAIHGHPTAFCLPDAEAVIKAKRRVLAAVHPLVVGRADRPRLELVTGGSILFVDMSTPIELWDQFGLIVVDNAADIAGLAELWEDVLLPTLARRRGHAWFVSKPRGVRNGFYQLYRRGDDDEPEWASFRLATPKNPYFDRARLEKDRADMDLDVYRQERLGEFVETPIELSALQTIIGKDETFLQWCERLAKDGLMVDGIPFKLDDRPAMHFIYNLIPATIQDAYLRVDVIMKCTQVGFTVMEMLAMIYLSIKFAPAKIGMFMPSQMLATGKSSKRFMPIVRTVPAVYRMMVEDQATGAKVGEGNVLTREIGSSLFHFLWTSGKTATESFPMDVISFDEVQEMAIADMEKTKERLSASRLRYTLMGSTANWPDKDIHWWYKKGTQHQFHSKCPHCATFQVLDEHFPGCIGFDPEAPRVVQREGMPTVYGEYRYRCHVCQGWLDNPQDGEWRPLNPDAEIRSVHFPQFLSPTISPREMIEAYYNADDMKNFFNRKLGKPYTDPSQVPVNLEMLNACAEEGMRLGVAWKPRAADTFMGIDQMGGYNVVIIAERLSTGHLAVIHVEEILTQPTPEDPEASPFDRCDVLMKQYGVQVCVVETLPNYNDAKRFANRHPGKVFLAGYQDMKEDSIRWGDAVPNSAERKTEEHDRDRYTVMLDQYKCMQVAMKRIQSKVTVFADPMGLVQEVFDKGTKGEKVVIPILKERVFLHFTRTALIADEDEEQRKFRRRVVKVGIDPHFSYAYMLLNVAWARAFGTSQFLFMEDQSTSDVLERAGSAATSPVIQVIREHNATLLGDVCGGCISFEEGMCLERDFRVRAEDVACPVFIPIASD